MRDYIEIGAVPCEEQCQQVGTEGYDPVRARLESRVFMHQIRRTIGIEPDGARLALKSFPHDFGSYIEAVCYYDDSMPLSVEYAFKCESDTPIRWDETSKVMLSGGHYDLGN